MEVEIFFKSENKAKEVFCKFINTMIGNGLAYGCVDFASVADLYRIADIESEEKDINRRGWITTRSILKNKCIKKLDKGGYILSLPAPQPFC